MACVGEPGDDFGATTVLPQKFPYDHVTAPLFLGYSYQYFDNNASRRIEPTIFVNSTMVPRTPLRPIDPNRVPGKELSPYLRGQIYSLSKTKLLLAKIGSILEVSKASVQYTINKHAIREQGTTQKRTGRPLKLIENDHQRILAIIKQDLFTTYKEIR